MQCVTMTTTNAGYPLPPTRPSFPERKKKKRSQRLFDQHLRHRLQRRCRGRRQARDAVLQAVRRRDRLLQEVRFLLLHGYHVRLGFDGSAVLHRHSLTRAHPSGDPSALDLERLTPTLGALAGDKAITHEDVPDDAPASNERESDACRSAWLTNWSDQAFPERFADPPRRPINQLQTYDACHEARGNHQARPRAPFP